MVLQRAIYGLSILGRQKMAWINFGLSCLNRENEVVKEVGTLTTFVIICRRQSDKVCAFNSKCKIST